jgi:hypothetical protein
MTRHVELHWLYSANSTKELLKEAQSSSRALAMFKLKSQHVAKQLAVTIDYRTILTPPQQIMFEKILRIGPDALATEGGPKSSDIKELSDLTTEMIRAQNENTYKERTMQEIDQILSDVYDDDILNEKMSKTKYYFDLLDTWHGILAAVGRDVKKSYTESIRLRNKSAR